MEEIQCCLFDLGAATATPAENSSHDKLTYTDFSPNHTATLEKWIDEIDSNLPKLTNFVIPSGGLVCCHLNLSRAVCRRAERAIVPLVETRQVHPEVGIYLNRLSDFLFVLGRAAALHDGREEIIWRKVQ